MWDQEILGARTEAPGLHSQGKFSIVEVGIDLQNVEYPGVNEVELRPAGKKKSSGP
jgi:hypothetical protein